MGHTRALWYHNNHNGNDSNWGIARTLSQRIMQRMSWSEAEKYKFKMKYPPSDIISYIFGQADQHEPQGNLKTHFLFYFL